MTDRQKRRAEAHLSLAQSKSPHAPPATAVSTTPQSEEIALESHS
jgi:hypothetical protein